MNLYFVISQILVVLSAMLFFLSVQMRKKYLMLGVQILADSFFAIHFLLLNDMIAGYLALFGLGRLIVFFIIANNFDNNKKANKLSSIFFMTLFFIISIIQWNNIYSIIPLFCYLFLSFAFGFFTLPYIKISFFIHAALFVVYMLILGSYFGALAQLFAGVGALIGYLKTRKDITKVFA